MKTVKIQGSLGDQLFGLAFARSAAIVSEAPVALDLSRYAADPDGRGFELTAFAQSLGAFLIAHRPILASPATHVLSQVAPLPGFIRERRPPASERALRALIERGGYFSGQWRDEAYILDADRFRLQVRRLIADKGRRAAAGAVVLHYGADEAERVRRKGRAPTLRFYAEALGRIEQETGPVGEVVLVSDQPGLAQRRLEGLGRRIVPADHESDWEDLALMVRARALVLGKASLGWWGGFCSEARMVIYPRSDRYAPHPAPAARFLRL